MEEPDFYGAIDCGSGQSYLFAPRLPDSYAIWMGKLRTLEEIKVRYGVDQVHYSDMVRLRVLNQADIMNTAVFIKSVTLMLTFVIRYDNFG